MKINKLSIAILIGTALFTSCTKEIEFNGEQTDPKLVINSLLEPGKPIKAYITKSYFFLDNEPNTAAPDDLVASLYVNGNLIGELTPRMDTILEGYAYVDVNLDSLMNYYEIVPSYYSDYLPNEGDVVRITASANGFDDVDATTSPLPNDVDWKTFDLQAIPWEVSYYDYEGDTSWYLWAKTEILVEITDPNPGKTDYFKLYVDVGGYTDEETGSNYYISATYNDPVFGGTGSDYDEFDISFLSRAQGVFTDVLFDGRSYTIKIPLYISVDFSGEILPNSTQWPVRLEHLSKEYYNYLNTCQQGDELSQLFAEPVQTYTNVEGGYGIVGGRTVDTCRFAVPINMER